MLLFYRFLDWLRDASALTRLWLADRILGPEPQTPADRMRERQHDSSLRPFSAKGAGIGNSSEP